MSVGALCGVAPLLFRKKSSGLQGKERAGKYRNPFRCKKFLKKKSSPVHSSPEASGNFFTMTELKSQISIFRDLLDFPPCVGSAPLNELLIFTLNDISEKYPNIKLGASTSELKVASVHKSIRLLCDALKSLGDMWTTEKGTMKCKYRSSMKLSQVELEQMALMLMDDMITLARDRLLDEVDKEEQIRDNSRYSDSTSMKSSSLSSSPATPNSVLSGTWKPWENCRSPCLLRSPNVQAVRKLNPMDMKRLSLYMLPDAISVAQEAKHLAKVNKTGREEEHELEKKEKAEVKRLGVDKAEQDGMMDCMEMNDEVNGEPEVKSEEPEIGRSNLVGTMDDKGSNGIGALDVEQEAPPSVASPKQEEFVPLLEPSLPESPPKVTEQSVQLPDKGLVCQIPAPTTPPASHRNLEGPPSPPPSPLSPGKSGDVMYAPLQPTPTMAVKGPAPPPPPVKGSASKGSAPPPPPPGSRAKKAATKLKRSSQMGSLYRTLKGKVEGLSLEGKSSGKKGKVGAPQGGKQGMADALAEMTKRSAYFQQIEEDIKNYAGVIKELKSAISSFQTSDMDELIKFHNHIETHLEKLTDETQVLARFEDFPCKKLEVLRVAAALYTKLDTNAKTLQDWPVDLPLSQHLDKSESYFNKIKVEVDALERTKDAEVKKFRAQKINFDMGILVRIKELMVDVSSNCIEIALKEKREGKTNENGSTKMLWRAFQFAFRVYSFAGGQDDRADELTKELAQEIETS